MSLPNAFIDAVNNKNIRSIRIMMKNSLLVDTTFREYNEMEKAISGIPEVFVSHDGKELIADKSQWNEDYISRVMTQVIGNFSHERVNHLKEVVRYLRPPVMQSENASSNKKKQENNVRRPDRSVGNRQSEYQKQKSIDQANGNFRPQKIAMGAGIGAATGAAIMALASGSVVLGAVGGAAIGAGTAFVVTICPQKIVIGAGIGAATGAAIMASASGSVVLGAVGGAAIGAGTAFVVTNGDK